MHNDSFGLALKERHIPFAVLFLEFRSIAARATYFFLIKSMTKIKA